MTHPTGVAVVGRDRTPHRYRRVGGWILIETLIAVAVLTIVVSTAAPLVVTSIRGVGRSIAALQDRLLATNATLTAYRLLDDGASPQEVVSFLEERYPSVEIVVTDEEIVVAGERLWVGREPVNWEFGGSEWDR